jgi:hypothetical protein
LGEIGGESLPGKGIYPDITSRVLEEAGYKVEVFIIPWTRCIEEARAHEFNVIAAAREGEHFEKDFRYFNNISTEVL